MTVGVSIAVAPRHHRALSEHRSLRTVLLFLLYVAQGLPLGLMMFALPAWLAQNGLPAGAIGGVVAMVTLPWTFKLAYGCVMDRYAFLAMGRRRPWIAVGQVGLLVSFIALAVANPAAQDVALITVFAFALGLWSAVQDVAVDGLAVDILPPEDIERVNGVLFAGQAIGIAAGTAVGGYLLAWHGLPAASLALAGIIAAILCLILLVRERPGERLLPWTGGAASPRNLDLHVGAFGPIIRTLFASLLTRQTLLLLPAFVGFAAAWGIFLGLAPLFSAGQLGWEKATYSGWSSQAGLAAGLAAVLVFGPAAARWGARRMACIAALLIAGVALAMLSLQGQWGIPALFIGSIFAFNALRVLNLVCLGSLGMRLCRPEIAATQFAVFMAIANLGLALASASLGWLDSLGGITAMFAAMAVCGFIAAGFAFASKVGR
jgi:PAT family beta-lactamase induction signal transducer AmpG